MKKVFSFLVSSRLMAIILFVFAFSIAYATFIEKSYGTDAARKIVYNARWFELVLGLGVVNIIAVIFSRKLYRREKLSLFIFHIAFVLIIAGAGITRYFGKEGFMSIREGEKGKTWYSADSHIGIVVKTEHSIKSRSYPVIFSTVSKNRFRKSLTVDGHRIKIEVTGFIPKAEITVKSDTSGTAMLHMIANIGQGREDIILSLGQQLKADKYVFTFASDDSIEIPENRLNFYTRDGKLFFISFHPVSMSKMSVDSRILLEAGKSHEISNDALYYIDNIPFVIKNAVQSGRLDVKPAQYESEAGLSGVLIDLTCDGQTKQVALAGTKNEVSRLNYTRFGEISIGLNYGALLRELPFDVQLNDFKLERYPGSASPSSYQSYVQLIDPEKAVNREHHIYMNHVLKHRGYRFYQSSYDNDEKGSVLAVNKDGLGTFVTYFGYLLMTLGMLLSLLNKNSRFLSISRITKSMKSKATLVLAVSLFSLSTVSANDSIRNSLPSIQQEFAEKFSQILVQDNGGRIEPINTLASEVLRKVARKEKYEGQSPEQVLLGMLVYPEKWQKEPMIRINHPGLQHVLEQNSKFASFDDFFTKDKYRNYILQPYVEEAYRKEPAKRSKFENEIIRTDERLNVCYMVYTGSILRIFPAPDDSTNTWYSAEATAGIYAGEDSVFVRNILPFYFNEIRKSVSSGNPKAPDELIQAIELFQKYHGAKVIPAAKKVKAEIFYNNANLFVLVTRIYMLIGFILLFVQFIHIFIPRFRLKWFFIVAFILISLAFLMHTLGLGLRWYIAGHAPWSNGYEALIFIGWSTVLAGIIFSRNTGIALSVTAVLSSLILQTAHLSWMDPQVTNLVPVLKSYWLIVHVAVITASYGFLGLAALMAAVNLVLMTLQGKVNFRQVDDQISKLTVVIEMSLIAGLYLLTTGTFLGGVWANESWGRYWAWDPKETWALVTVLVYALILHLRLVPGLEGRLIFNSLALVGFSSVIMTYFGVNYYLTGLHSYARGDSMPVPPIVYWTIIIVLVLLILAILNQYRIKKQLIKYLDK